MRIRISDLIKILIPFGILAYVYYPTFLWMVDRWSVRDSYYSHGFLIPAVTLYWIYAKRKQLRETPLSADTLGLAVLLLGASMQIAASILRIYFLSAFSFVFMLFGTVQVLFGRAFLKQIWYPLAFLFLMIPLPLLTIADITLKMKFFVAQLAAGGLNAIGIHAVRQGSYIVTPHSTLLVGDPCSGLRSFLAFLCLGFVFAYGPQLNWWKKGILIVLGLPLAILFNVARVFSLSLLGEIYGPGFVSGKLHDASGYAAFIAAFCIFLILRKKMEAPCAKAG